MSDIYNRPMEEIVVEELTRYGLTVATAESCTGGLLAGRIINAPGASSVYGAGFVTYSNKAKRKYLKVKKSTLKKHGAVSRKCAKEMVKGLLSETGADAGLVTTGIAGPGGGTDEKPVGLVYIGCGIRGKIKVRKFLFEGDRIQVRESAVSAALKMLKKALSKYDMESEYE